MTSKLTRERIELIANFHRAMTLPPSHDEIEELARMALVAMGSEHKRNPVLAYADSYRDMAKQGVESVPIWSVITDLERNIAPLYRYAQPAPVVPEEIASAIEGLKQTLVVCNRYNYCSNAVKRVEDACHASMLNGGKS
ncbi:TPA: hypothetical protein ACT1U1_001020 [Raoultella ornithinolytica]